MKALLLPLLIAFALVGCKPQDPAPLPPQVGTRSVPPPAAPAEPVVAPTTESAVNAGDAATAATVADASAATPIAAGVDGEAVYKKACITCHGTGLAGAPKLGDSADWGPRIAQGEALLLEHAIKGYTGKKGMMPPKGGFMTLTDDEIRAAIEYMTNAPAAP